ncbi:GGDEF domain-containing protein [Actinoplanes palleronii]|uniref:GGDEF domain-containing protein n=1 Tax=Actinoplanes palleronii TaxID=113570 RepID=UPI0019443C79|nr:GGDEF domain-containing protein [Actinoplanes palleronii]
MGAVTRPSTWPAVVLRGLGPRQAVAARLWIMIMIGTCTAVFFTAALLGDGGLDPLQLGCGVVLALFCLTVLLLRPERAASLCVAGPLLGVAGVVVLDLGTADAGVTGQIFFTMPVLYAAVHLRVPGSVLVTAAAIGGDAIVVGRLLPLDQALTDLAFTGGMLILMGSVLTRAMVTQQRLVEKLRRQASVDPLTGLVTRRVLDDAVSAISSATSDAGTALVLIDVDKFKTINDTYGHAVGDDALVHIAAVLSARCRPQDVLARMGGDELAVLMPGCSYETALGRARDFVRVIHDEPLPLADGRRLPLSISAGAAHAHQHTGSARDLYISADTALYAAKRAGRGRVGELTT